jgi:hypothetical protein
VPASAAGTLRRPYRDDQHLPAGLVLQSHIKDLHLLDTEQFPPYRYTAHTVLLDSACF